MADLAILQPVFDTIQDAVLQVVLPILGSAVVAALAWAAAQAAKVLGDQRAVALKQKIIEALVNSLTETAGAHTPGTVTFDKAVTEAAAYAKNVAYPDATAKVATSALETMAAKELNGLIERGVARVSGS